MAKVKPNLAFEESHLSEFESSRSVHPVRQQQLSRRTQRGSRWDSQLQPGFFASRRRLLFINSSLSLPISAPTRSDSPKSYPRCPASCYSDPPGSCLTSSHLANIVP
jgi:hypothetical protein